MKNKFKLPGIIALVALIGFSMTACDDEGTSSPAGGGGGGGGGGGVGNPTITVQNNTGYTINGIWMKPSTSTDWGSNLWGFLGIPDGQSRTFTLPQPLSVQNVYDILLSQQSGGGGHNFSRYGLTVTNGMTVNFTTAQFDDGSNLPSITIQNRSGVTFNSVHIKPSVSPNWDTRNFGSISNNSDRSVTIPIPPSNFTAFDIQMRSTNPTNTYTRNNVTISDGMTLLFTSADMDNPTIELPVIVIQNNTGFTINGIWIRPSTSTDWGSNLWGFSGMPDGQLRTFRLPQHLSAQTAYDIRLAQNSGGGGHNFIRNTVMVSEGMVITFTPANLQQ